MDDRAALERRFDAAMLDIYHGAARLGYRPTRFLEMVQVHGGVETAHRLLATEKVQDGLGELFLLNRLDCVYVNSELTSPSPTVPPGLAEVLEQLQAQTQRGPGSARQPFRGLRNDFQLSS